MCPSQWDAWDEEGNYYYLRYRHGYGEMRQYKDENWVGADWKPDDEINKEEAGWGVYANTSYIRTIAVFEHGDPLDGCIELDEFCQLAGVELDKDLVYTNFGEHLRDELVTRAGFAFLLDDKKNDDET
jgi:hypothetical protein